MKTLKLTMFASISALALAACSSEAPTTTDTEVVADESTAGDNMVAAEASGDKNIVALAQGNPDVSTLVSAVTAAGLGETLSGTGPFTVIAPTNAAFAKVDKATLDGLMKPESKDKLGGILKYHVISGNIKSGDLGQADRRWRRHRDHQDAERRQPEGDDGRRQDRPDRCQGRQSHRHRA